MKKKKGLSMKEELKKTAKTGGIVGHKIGAYIHPHKMKRDKRFGNG